MCYRLFKRITATCLLVSEGRMASLPQRYGTTLGGEKVYHLEKDHTLTDRVCTFKQLGLNAETKKVSAPSRGRRLFS
jgi:hypothetical protein